MMGFGRTRIVQKLGRRGMALLLFGLLWIVYGFGVAAQPTERFSRPGPGGPLEFLDSPWLGLGWIAAGLCACVTAPVRLHRRGHDGFGFAVLLIPPFVWLLCYVWSFALWLVTDGASGRSTAWLPCVVWAIVSLAVMLVAGWSDPDDPAFRTDIGEG